MPPRATRDLKKKQKLPVATTSSKIEKRNRVSLVETSASPSRPSSSTSRKKPSPAKSKSDAVFKIPDNLIPIVDFRIETSPKRIIAETPAVVSDKSTAASKQEKYRNNKTSLSMITVEKTNGDTTNPSFSATPLLTEPLSTGSRILLSTRRSQTSASDSNYDNASTADSVADLKNINNGRIKRTETERKQYFMNETECGSIEAHRALCIRCKKWVRLSSRQTYCVKPWEIHRGKCDQKVPAEHTYLELGLVANLPFVVPRTENVCKAILELDDATEIIEPEQIKCKTCEQWVPLEKRYSLECWSIHKAACHNNLNPNEIQEILERKLFFLCDMQFKSFHNSKTVECVVCNRKVALDSEVDYDLEKWLAHKKSCHLTLKGPRKFMGLSDSALPNIEQEMHPQIEATPISVPTNNIEATSSTGPQSRPALPSSDSHHGYEHIQTLSTTDSERTLVPPSSSTPTLPSLNPLTTVITIPSSSSQISTPGSTMLKRKRDTATPDDEDGLSSAPQTPYTKDADMEREMLTKRPRTGVQLLEEDDAPSGLELFLLPFKAFVKGFKESLTTES